MVGILAWRIDMGIRDLLFVGLILGASSAVGISLYPRRIDAHREAKPARSVADPGLTTPIQAINAVFRQRWQDEGLAHAAKAPELAVIRRLSLALTGTIPSLEELRSVQTVPDGQKVDYWVESLLRDRRFADYFAERLARAYVGTEGGPFIVYRRRRFVSWLSDALHENAPYDQIVRDLIETDGLWTDHPATNFLTVTYDPDKKQVDPERLAGRVARAFLGVRIDCAQCHDHPFERWTRNDFQGIAAFFGQAQSGFTGIHEEPGEFQPLDRKTGKTATVAPCVPFQPELLPAEGNRRARLGRWLTDPKNPMLARASVNRVWALMFGRALVEPVDDLASAEELPEALTLLADDFSGHSFDLRRLIRVVAALEVFRLDSALDTGETEAHERACAVFPLTRLRPDQVVGGLLQAASLTTIDGESPILVRIARTIGHSQFVERYGDTGEDEFDGRAGTIPQRLLMMNGELVHSHTKSSILGAASRVGYFAPTDRAAVEISYLIALTRKPTAEELAHFEAKLAGTKGDPRGEQMSDLFWTLVNATEFSWNH
jgi:hypothetical protein